MGKKKDISPATRAVVSAYLENRTLSYRQIARKTEISASSVFNIEKSQNYIYKEDYRKKEMPRFQCIKCNLTFNKKFNLKRHVRTKHQSQQSQRFQCDICKKFFTREDTLIKHKTTLHDVSSSTSRARSSTATSSTATSSTATSSTAASTSTAAAFTSKNKQFSLIQNIPLAKCIRVIALRNIHQMEKLSHITMLDIRVVKEILQFREHIQKIFKYVPNAKRLLRPDELNNIVALTEILREFMRRLSCQNAKITDEELKLNARLLKSAFGVTEMQIDEKWVNFLRYHFQPSNAIKKPIEEMHKTYFYVRDILTHVQHMLDPEVVVNFNKNFQKNSNELILMCSEISGRDINVVRKHTDKEISGYDTDNDFNKKQENITNTTEEESEEELQEVYIKDEIELGEYYINDNVNEMSNEPNELCIHENKLAEEIMTNEDFNDDVIEIYAVIDEDDDDNDAILMDVDEQPETTLAATDENTTKMGEQCCIKKEIENPEYRDSEAGFLKHSPELLKEQIKEEPIEIYSSHDIKDESEKEFAKSQVEKSSVKHISIQEIVHPENTTAEAGILKYSQELFIEQIKEEPIDIKYESEEEFIQSQVEQPEIKQESSELNSNSCNNNEFCMVVRDESDGPQAMQHVYAEPIEPVINSEPIQTLNAELDDDRCQNKEHAIKEDPKVMLTIDDIMHNDMATNLKYGDPLTEERALHIGKILNLKQKQEKCVKTSTGICYDSDSSVATSFSSSSSSSSENNLTLILVAAAAHIQAEKERCNKKKKRPRCRVNPYLAQRQSKGRFATDFDDMKAHPPAFYEHFHMSFDTFNVLLKKIEHHLLPERSLRHDLISPCEKLAAVLEFFASGSMQKHVASTYRISKQHMGSIINSVCDALCAELKGEIEEPSVEKFNNIAEGYNERWQFPHCVGAIDGKHVAFKAPFKSGSILYNYKGFHSIVLCAVADSQYMFTYVDVGAYGSDGDANVFSASSLGKNLAENKIHFPPGVIKQGDFLPYFFIGDDAFPLSERLLKPYSASKNSKLTTQEHIFNYRLSRARRCIENAFGILCAKWLCLKRTMFCSPDRAQKIVYTCCLLHNFLLKQSRFYCPAAYADNLDEYGNVVDGEWRRDEQNLRRTSILGSSLESDRGRQSNSGIEVRDKLKIFFNSPEGSVPWQYQAIE